MSAEDIHWDYSQEWERECAETDARVRQDVQELVCRAEEIFAAWARDGLLDKRTRRSMFDPETRQMEWRTVILADRDAIDLQLQYLTEILMDARSLTAVEAADVARGER